MLSPATFGVSRRQLLSTATALAFAIGFGAGVLGAFLMSQPSDSGAGLARAAAHPPDDAAYAPESAPDAMPAHRSDVHITGRAALLEALGAEARSAASEPIMLAGLPLGLSREAESAGQARLAKAVLSTRAWFTEQITVRRGDTLMDILSRAGIAAAEAHAAVQSLLTVYDPRRLRAGQELLIRAAHEPAAAGARRLLGLDFDLDFDQAVRVTRGFDPPTLDAVLSVLEARRC